MSEIKTPDKYPIPNDSLRKTQERLSQYLVENLHGGHQKTNLKPAEYPTGKAILGLSPPEHVLCVTAINIRARWLEQDRRPQARSILIRLRDQLLQRKLPYRDSDLVELGYTLAATVDTYRGPNKRILQVLERRLIMSRAALHVDANLVPKCSTAGFFNDNIFLGEVALDVFWCIDILKFV